MVLVLKSKHVLGVVFVLRVLVQQEEHVKQMVA